MWLPRPRRAGALVLVLVAPLLLGGCSGFRPVYGEAGIAPSALEFRYEKPATRLAQIVIQDLGLRLGRTDDPDAPSIRVTAAWGSRALTRTDVSKPRKQYEATVTATYSVLSDGAVVATGTRRATAQYEVSGQVMADEAAEQDAYERAAHAVADTIRLAILGQLATPTREAALAP